MRLTLPQPYEDIGHTADLGIRVHGATAEEALTRLALALGTVLGGEGAFPPEREECISVGGGGDAVGAAVAFLRELLYRFATAHLFPCACEVTRADGQRAEGFVAFARWDPEVAPGGADVKAVTWHAAKLERDADGWVGQVVLDV
ncbi:MAG TPA: archease [Anaeromyxobacteraceae bacterium]|nr:archease [Anaeromyxobacteraceae bacterium]